MLHATALAKQAGAHLVGIFLDDFTAASYTIYDIMEESAGISRRKQNTLSAKDEAIRRVSISKFEKACQEAKLEYSVHRDRSLAMQELLQESIYADLLVISQHETFTGRAERHPTAFIRELLGNVLCPVMVVPARYKPIEKIVLLYDGEPASVYAIRNMSTIMGDWRQLPSEAVCVKNSGLNLHLPDGKLMKEFMKRHFPEAKYAVLKGDAEETIPAYLKEQRTSSLVVLGAYRRGVVSRWFRPSMADVLMRELKLPLFIAHR